MPQLAEDGNYSVKALNFLHSQIVERECLVEIHHFNAVNRRFLVSNTAMSHRPPHPFPQSTGYRSSGTGGA